MIRKDKVVAIMNIDTAGESHISRRLLNNVLKKGKVQKIAEEGKEKSFIITESGFFLSPISSVTLLKRSMNKVDFD